MPSPPEGERQGAPAELTFAFVDLAGYTALTEAHGDQSAADVAAAFYALADGALAGGTHVVKHIGDAVMLVAARTADCAETVLAMFDRAQEVPGFPALRAGLCAGTATERGGDYFGATVNVAARVASHARPGEVLCGASVARAAADDEALVVTPLGSVALKNVVEPVALFRLGRAGVAGGLSRVDPVCRMRLGPEPVTLDLEGTRYYFCSVSCAERFRTRPRAYR